MTATSGAASAVREVPLLRWTGSGYASKRARLRGIDEDVLTPPSIVTVLAAGYTPLWHDSADARSRKNLPPT